MILDSLVAMLLSGLLAGIDSSAPSGWMLDSFVVTVNYEVEISVEDVGELYAEPRPSLPAASRNFASVAQHPWLITGQPLDSWRLHQQWGFESEYESASGSYAFSRHPLGSGWDLRIALVHESVPTHAQEARWAFAHGLF